MAMASIGGSDGNSDYVESAKNLPTILDNTPDLAGHTREMEGMHEVTAGELNTSARKTVLFYHTDEIKNLEIPNANTDLPGNHQDNGAKPPANTQPSPPHAPPEDTSVASAKPTLHPRIDAGDYDIQVQEGDLLNFHLLGADYTLYGVYQDWVHQNTGDHLNVGIAEDSKWKARWKKLVCMKTQCYDAPYGKFGNRFLGILSVELDGVCARKWNTKRVIIFNPLS